MAISHKRALYSFTSFLFYFYFQDSLLLSTTARATQITPLIVLKSQPPSRGIKGVPEKTPPKYTAESPSLGARFDVLLRLLIPAAPLLVLTTGSPILRSGLGLHMSVAAEYLDVLCILLYSNPLLSKTKFFDLSCFVPSGTLGGISAMLYYVFQIPVFRRLLIVLVPASGASVRSSSSSYANIVSIEKLFKAASWGEREVGELFGIPFLGKVSNRKLISDYFLKSYPLLKWVPSVGFSEVYCSSEGFFYTRSVKIFNSALS